MMNKVDGLLDFHAEALKLRARRQELLASNLANGDTPHYKAVDFKFADALRSATGAQAPQPAMPVRTQAGHMVSAVLPAIGTDVLFRSPQQPSVDGNTVDMDTERAQFADNTVRYEAALQFLDHHIKTLLAASSQG